MLFSGRDSRGIRPVRRYLYDPDDRKTYKGRWEDRDRACRPDRGLKQQGDLVDFIKMSTETDGIISTKVPLIRRGNELNFITVQRCFLLDSMAYENLRQQQHQVKPDYIEVLPGIMPQVISKMCKVSKAPIIAGGLISEKESVMSALSAGAMAVSSTNHEVWKL